MVLFSARSPHVVAASRMQAEISGRAKRSFFIVYVLEPGFIFFF